MQRVLLGGLKHHVQEFNRVSARTQAGLLFLATAALLIPSAVSQVDFVAGAAFTQTLSVGLAVLLIVAYGLGMLFSLKTHREMFASAEPGEAGEAPWPIGLALATLAGVTVLVALVSEVFVESVQKVAEAFGMTPAFVGFIVVALVGGAAEMTIPRVRARSRRSDWRPGVATPSACRIVMSRERLSMRLLSPMSRRRATNSSIVGSRSKIWTRSSFRPPRHADQGPH